MGEQPIPGCKTERDWRTIIDNRRIQDWKDLQAAVQNIFLAHELLAHILDGSRLQLGDTPMTAAWAWAHLQDAEQKAAEVRRKWEEKRPI